MNLSTLRTRLQSHSGDLDIDFSGIESPGLAEFLAPLLGGLPHLRLAEVKPLTADIARLSVSGVGTSAPFKGMLVTLTFLQDAGADTEFDVEIDALATDHWQICGAFPELASTAFQRLTTVRTSDFDPPTLRIRSRDKDACLRGMTLENAASLQAFPLLALLADTAKPVALAGRFDIRHLTNPLFYPRGVSLDTAFVRLPGLGLRFKLASKARNNFPVRLENITGELAATPRFDIGYNGWWLDSSVYIAADMMLGHEAPVKIPVWAEGDNGHGGSVVLHAALGDAIKSSLRGLSSLLGGRIPSPIEALSLDDAVDLVDLEVELINDSDRGAVSRLSCEIQTRDALSWELIDDLITLEAINLQCRVARPFSSDSEVSMTVSGLFGVGRDGVLQLVAEVKRDAVTRRWEPIFYGSLEKGSKISATEVFSHFFDIDETELPALNVTTFNIELAPASNRFSAGVALAGQWPLPAINNVVLEAVELGFDHEGDAGTAFRVHAGLRIDECWLNLVAEYESNGRGFTFKGGAGGIIPAGMGLDHVAARFDTTLPACVKGLELSDLTVRFNTASKDLSFSGTAAFPIDGKVDGATKAELTVHVDLTHQPGGGRKASFGGLLNVADRKFHVVIGTESDKADLLVASYAKTSDRAIGLRDLIDAISPTTAAHIPKGITIKVDHAQLAIASSVMGRRFLFGVELGAGVDLSKLPLVGGIFQRGQSLAMTFQVLVANASFDQDEIARINQLSATSAMKLPEGALNGIAQPLQIRTQLNIGGKQFPLSLPLDPPGTPSVSAGGMAISVAAGAEAMVKWFPVQQVLGPFHFERVGVGLSSSGKLIELLLDASLEVGGLSLSVAGLGAELDLVQLSKGNLTPSFHLDGLGVDFQKQGLEIGGALVRRPNATDECEYDGAVTVHYKQLGIVGLGSYAISHGHPSLFVYALINYPIGGPPIFFVEGLSFGFGYNRAMQMPTLEDVSNFPLVALAREPDPHLAPVDVAARLARYIRPADGEYFIAAGVKFHSFKTLDGFVLLVLVLGQRFEVDLLGVATLTSPPKTVAGDQPMLMQAKLTMVARYEPEKGELHVRGSLIPDAYLFAPGCHLTGGFAFSSWRRATDVQTADGKTSRVKAGDFVLTMGGYHAAFDRPAHYPQVPRLGLNWEVSPNLSLKADAYFALTPSAFMVGGHLRANWQSGDLHAWFNAGVDCLVAWQPYHFEAEVQVAIGASYRTWCHTFTVELTAKLEIWGPPFSGTAHVTWYIFSFDTEFGSKVRPTLTAAKWLEFESAFLPESKDVLTISAQAGKVAPHGKVAASRDEHYKANSRDQIGLVNARDLCISIGSAIPITNGSVLGEQLEASNNRLGIAPMGATSLNAQATITLKRVGHADLVHADFVWEPVEQEVPSALWGTQGLQHPKAADANVNSLVPALTGFLIRPKPIRPGANLPPLTRTESTTRADLSKAPRAHYVATGAGLDDVKAMVGASIHSAGSREGRKTILQAFLPDTACDWSAMTVDAWRDEPQLARMIKVG